MRGRRTHRAHGTEARSARSRLYGERGARERRPRDHELVPASRTPPRAAHVPEFSRAVRLCDDVLQQTFFEGRGRRAVRSRPPDSLCRRTVGAANVRPRRRSRRRSGSERSRCCSSTNASIISIPALCPLASGHVLAFMDAFSPHAQTLLRRTIEPEFLIEVSAADALDFACNAVEIGDAIVLHSASPRLRERLHAGRVPDLRDRSRGLSQSRRIREMSHLETRGRAGPIGGRGVATEPPGAN